MKIYTKTGDKGSTSLMGGKRVDKSDLRIKAYGDVDELNSLIGVVLSDLADYTSEVFSRRRPGFTSEVDSGSNLSLRGVLRLRSGRRSNPPSRHSRPDRESVIDSRFRGNDSEMADVKKRLLRIQNELLVLGSDLATPLDVKIKVPRVTKTFVTRLEKEIDKWTASLPALRNFILPGGGSVGSKLHLARTAARRAERSIAALSQSETINKFSQIYINRLSDWFFTLARYVNKLDNQKEIIWKGR